MDATGVNTLVHNMSDDLKDRFDAVVMLTWSDWKTEPRSNRYHYASRFARTLPVYFVQPSAPPLLSPLERTELSNVTILHTGTHYGRAQSQLIESVLARQDVRRPLIWVYNVFYNDFIARHTNQMVIYHGTEDYLSDPGKAFVWGDLDPIIEGFARTLPHVDMTISVAESIRRNFRERGGYGGPSLLMPNGCDDKFWIGERAHDHVPQNSGRPIAFYQGAINARLDFDLLRGVVRAMPDWDFWFCGRSVDPPGWGELQAEPNVTYLGMLSLEKVAAAARNATVAISPFVDQPLMRISVNLKYYEYVACGLPVVSSPNDALLDRPDVFTVVSGVDDFVKAVRALAPTRADANSIQHRLTAAGEQSYDKKFALVCEEISRCHDELAKSPGHRNVLVLHSKPLADGEPVPARLVALQRDLPHSVFYSPHPDGPPALAHDLRHGDLTGFDAVVFDASFLGAGKRSADAELVRFARNYDGCKIALLGDVRWNRRMRVFLERLRVDAVVTSVAEADVRADWTSAQRVPAVVAWGEGAAADVAAALDEIIVRAAFKKPRAGLPTAPVRDDRKLRSVDVTAAEDIHPMAALLPGNPQSSEWGLIAGFLLLALVRAFFFCWGCLPKFVRAPVVALLPKRMREAIRDAALKISVH